MYILLYTLPLLTHYIFVIYYETIEYILTGLSSIQQLDMVQKARCPEIAGIGDVDYWEPTNVQHESTSPQTMILLRNLLSYDQRKRPNATTALRNDAFIHCRQEEKERNVVDATKIATAKIAAQAKVAAKAATDAAQLAAVKVTTTRIEQQKGKENATGFESSSSFSSYSSILADSGSGSSVGSIGGVGNVGSSSSGGGVAVSPTRSKRVTQLLREEGYQTPTSSSEEGNQTSPSRSLRSNSEHVLRQAFKKYDDQNTGYIDAKAVSKMLGTW